MYLILLLSLYLAHAEVNSPCAQALAEATALSDDLGFSVWDTFAEAAAPPAPDATAEDLRERFERLGSWLETFMGPLAQAQRPPPPHFAEHVAREMLASAQAYFDRAGIDYGLMQIPDTNCAMIYIQPSNAGAANQIAARLESGYAGMKLVYDPCYHIPVAAKASFREEFHVLDVPESFIANPTVRDGDLLHELQHARTATRAPNDTQADQGYLRVNGGTLPGPAGFNTNFLGLDEPHAHLDSLRHMILRLKRAVRLKEDARVASLMKSIDRYARHADTLERNILASLPELRAHADGARFQRDEEQGLALALLRFQREDDGEMVAVLTFRTREGLSAPETLSRHLDWLERTAHAYEARFAGFLKFLDENADPARVAAEAISHLAPVRVNY